jgi:hypothetical protein
MFTVPDVTDRLTQGDILDDCPLVSLSPDKIPGDPRAMALQQLIAGGKRVASLAPPYREHLAQHFAVTYMRVALPEPYATQP